MVDHTSSHEELNAYWLEKNATSKWDQGHTHYVDPNDDDRFWPSDCPECRSEKLSMIEDEVEFWDAPYWTEKEIRSAFGWFISPKMLDTCMKLLKENDRE